MPLGLSVTDDAAEEVFYAQGEEHLAVGFQFWEIDDNIGFQGLSREVDLAERGADIDRLRRLKRSADHIEALQGGAYSPVAEDLLKRPHGRAVKDHGRRLPRQDILRRRPNHQGMGQDGLFRPRRRQEIGFQENPAARWDLGAAKDIHDLKETGTKVCGVIRRRPHNDIHGSTRSKTSMMAFKNAFR